MTERAAYAYLLIVTLIVVLVGFTFAFAPPTAPKPLGGPPPCLGLEGEVPDCPAP